MLALACCLQQLEPKPDDLENADNKLIWCNRLQCIRPVIQVIKTMQREQQQQSVQVNSEARFHDQLFGGQAAHIWHGCRCVCFNISSTIKVL